MNMFHTSMSKDRSMPSGEHNNPSMCTGCLVSALRASIDRPYYFVSSRYTQFVYVDVLGALIWLEEGYGNIYMPIVSIYKEES